MALDPKEDVMTRVVVMKDALNAYLHEAARYGVELELFVGHTQPILGPDGLNYTAKQLFLHRVD